MVWNGSEYALETYARSDAAIKPLLTHLGRTFLTSVTLQAAPNYRMRCVSHTDIGWQELFGARGASGRTFEKFVRENGRAEAIWYPFTERPWMKVWSLAPTKPPFSREVTGPYNYIFSDNLPEPVTDMIGQINAGNPGIAPAFGQIMYATTVAGLAATFSNDLWGWSKDVQFYIRATTLRLTEGGGAVITSRANIGQVIHDFTQWFNGRMEYYRSIGQFPLNGPVEIRCCGLDQPSDVEVDSAGAPTISAMRPRPDHPEWDTAIWLNVLGVPGTPACSRSTAKWNSGCVITTTTTTPPSAPSGPKAGRSAPTSRTPTPRSSPRASPDLPRRRPIERQLGHRQRRIQRVGSAQGLQQHLPGPVAALRSKHQARTLPIRRSSPLPYFRECGGRRALQ